MSEMSTRFNFQEVEGSWRQRWEAEGVFHGRVQSDKRPYSIVIPPPNVTGILHMGHALNTTLQDIVMRYQRMRGHETCWMPGTDHAGIATQNVVEKQLAREGKTRYDLGRDAVIERLWAWKQQYGDTIITQLKQIGASCDWERTRFTMDDDYSQAVRHVFVSLYEKGLIYQGQYIINWCPRCQTALSDEEAEHHEHQGMLYFLRYPLKDDPRRWVTVATTRPETMLGDTAVAVNPQDERYRELIGAALVLPIVDREIPIIADDFVDPAFGTGAVKVTPAHDPNDFEMGQRHGLEVINVMHSDGRMNEAAGEFAGMDRFEARQAILELLREMRCLDHQQDHAHAVGHCYRCHTVVEPRLSKQWFVRMRPLAEPALKVVEEGRVVFYPERWNRVYTGWLENIRDWCISRQIWWGHRIPVWYCEACPEVIVTREDPVACPHCGGTALRQDEDVLDTWFSSWLWPFATFGWPNANTDLAYFYPTRSLFTASEIIFFWVARMIMAGLEFMGEVPFREVFIHGTVRDAQGRKMSKSLGNAIDPLEIIKEYGADALRFSLIINSGQDIFISKDKFEIGRNFANKIWNASRLVLMTTAPENRVAVLPTPSELSKPVLKWVVSRLHQTIAGVEAALGQFRFSEAENLIYDFFWNIFCDWYLEMVKTETDDPQVQRVSFAVLDHALRMIHPFMPFVTDEIWSHCHEGNGVLLESPWPSADPSMIDPEAEETMSLFMEWITSVRNARAQWHVKPTQGVRCVIVGGAASCSLLAQMQGYMWSLARVEGLVCAETATRVPNAASGVVKDTTFFIVLDGVVDIEREKARMQKECADLEKMADGVSRRLANEQFLAQAPAEVVERDRQRMDELKAKAAALQAVLVNM